MREDGVGSVPDKNAFVIGLPLTYEPGTRWDYSNEGVQLLSPILDQAAGEPIQDYARRRLFEPIGMLDTRLHVDEAGHAWMHADMETTLRDFARIGLLMLNRGTWEDRQIVSESWVVQSITASQLNPDYGLLWWLIGNPEGFSAQGHLDTDLYVFPEHDLVVARMQAATSDVPEGSYESEALLLFERLVGNR
jgi:CubicO group peptidase (beta-lactamase class C family)